MRTNHPEAYGLIRFFGDFQSRKWESHHPQSGRPVLYLKCWGSDYPYLQGAEQQKRWLPAVVPSPIKSPLLPL